jgi:hypothetical protein
MTDPRIVAALREATGETLRQDAESLARFAAMDGYPEGDRMGIAREPLQRAAAVLLAVAEMQEKALDCVEWDGVWHIDSDDEMTASRKGDTLPAALAALLEGGR